MRKIIRSLARRWNQLWKQFVARMQRKAMLLDLRQSFMALETRQVLAGASFNPGLGVLSMQLQNGETATLSQNLDQFVLDLPDAEPDVVGNIADLVRIEAKGIGPGNNGTFLWGGVTNNDFTAANVITLSVQDILSTDINVQSQGIIIQGDSSASNFSMVNSGSIQLTNEATSPFTFGESLTLITTNDASGIRIDGNLQAANNTLNPDVIIRTEGIDAAIFIDGNISLAGDPGAGPNSTLTVETLGTGGSSGVGISFVSSQITTTDDATDIALRSLGGNIDMDNASRIDAMAGSIELTANSSVKFTGLNSSNTDPNAIQVTSQTSELIDANALSTDANASLGGIFLRAANGIGNTDTLEVRVGTLSAINSTSGKISIFNQSVSTDNDLILDLVENANRDIEIFNESAGIQQTSSGHIIGNQVTLIADASVFDLVNLDTPLRSSFNRSISLTNSTNAVSSLIGLATGEILLTTQNDLNVIALRAQESIASPGGFEFQSTAGINQIIIESLSANITQGNLPSNQIATHRFSAIANNGSVTLDNTNNNALAVSGSAQNNFLYTDANSFEVQGITASNDVTISAQDGSITQAAGDSNAIRSSRTNATANNGSVTLDNTNNNALNVSGSAQNNFLYTDANSFEVQGITAGNDVTISAQDGSITQAAGASNAIRSSRTNATANNGSVTLDNTNNNALNVSGSAQNNFLYTDANSFEVQGITAGNDVTISALNGSITQATGASNAIRSIRTNATANNGSVTLDNTNNNALNVSGSAQNNFLYTDANSFEVQGITSGGDVVLTTVAGGITQASSSTAGIKADKLTLRIDATTTPNANQITVDGWGRNNATLNSVGNDVNKLDAISSGSIRFVNNGSLQVGTIVALSKDFVTGSTNTVATIANEVSLDSRQGGISQIYSPVTPQYNPFQAHSLRAVVATHAFFPDIDVVRLKISPLKDNVLKNSNLPSVLGDVFNDGSTLSQVYNAANASASKFLDTLATNNPRFVVTQELRDIYSLTKYNNNFAVLVLNRGDLIVDGIHAFEGKVSSAQGDSITAPNFLVATVESTASAVKGASAGDLIIPANSKIEGLSLGTETPVVVGQDSGLVILAGRDLIFGTAPSLTSGQIGTTPLTDNPQYRQIVLSKSLAEKFYNGGEGVGNILSTEYEGVGNILSTEYVVGAETSWKDSKNDTHQQQRVALDFGTQLAGGPERGFDVIISYFDGRTQRFANATEQGTTYPLPQSDPSIPPGPTNPLLLPTDERISIPSTKIASGIEDMQFRNNVVFQRTEPLAVRSIDMLRMLTPTNTLATNAVVRRSADFFMFENVNSAFTDPSGLQDITFASSYIDNVKPLVLAWSMMDENPQMQMPQILPSEMMELEDRLPLIRQDKSDIEIKAAQRTVEVAVYDIGYVDADTSTNASNKDRPDESQIDNAVDEQQPLLKFIAYRVKEDDLVEAIRIETLRRIVELVENNENDSISKKLRLGGGFAVKEFVNGAPEKTLGTPFLITKDEIDTELDKGTQP
ncbi:MAG: beta strand repeat-containing protein [Planctomycetota bacterium]